MNIQNQRNKKSNGFIPIISYIHGEFTQIRHWEAPNPACIPSSLTLPGPIGEHQSLSMSIFHIRIRVSPFRRRPTIAQLY